MKKINQSTPNMPKSKRDILHEILTKSISRYSANLELCRESFSEESVHGLRVSARRLIAVVRVINKIIPDSNTALVVSTLKSQLNNFNPLRDTQVMLLAAQGMIKDYPALELFASALKESEENCILSMKKQIQQISFLQLKPAFEEISNSCSIRNVSDSIIIAHIINSLNSSFTRVIELNGIASPDNTEALHRVRLAFKKFRYRAEAFSTIINYPEIKKKKLGKFQGTLGAIQDNSILLDSISKFSSDKHLAKEFSSAILEINKKGAALVEIYFRNAKFLFDFWLLPQAPAFLLTSPDSSGF